MSAYKGQSTGACHCASCSVLERVRFFPQQLVTSEDLNDQVEYVLNKLRRHNRYLHGFGIVCGLDVTAPDAAQNETGYSIAVAPGYALSPFGDEVYVAEAFNWDLSDAIFGGPEVCPPKTPEVLKGCLYYAAIRPVACFSRPVRVRADSCGCDDGACEFSRVRESFEYDLLSELPQSYEERNIRLDQKRSGHPPCLPCPTDNWVVIAKLRVGLQRIEVVPTQGLILTTTTLMGPPVADA